VAEIRWTFEALRCLEGIHEYIAADNPRAAELERVQFQFVPASDGTAMATGGWVEVAAVEWSGSWDTHEKQVTGSVIDRTNPHASSLATGATDLVAFWRDIADLRDNVVVMIGSEFGRTVHENGTTGTDHGNGGAWFAFGGPTRGGIYNGMTTVEASRLQAGRYIPVLTNYKDMLGEAMVRHLGVSDTALARIIPGHAFTNHGMFSASV
jgi:uncharacterized protein (DUF1501 family)